MIRSLPRHLLIGLASFFIIAVATVSLMRGGVNSPDEAANKLFMHTWAAQNSLTQKIATPQPQTYPLFPRSMMPAGDSVTPSGFVGIIVLYGSIAKIIGTWALAYLTIIFTLSASIAWWYLMRKIFSEPIADCAFWFFLFHPAVLYYTVRGLFPNMLLMDLLIMSFAGAWFVVDRFHKQSRKQLIAMGIVTGITALCAIAVRPPEALVVYATSACVAIIFGTRTVKKIAYAAIALLIYIGIMAWLIHSWHIVPGGYSFLDAHSLWAILFPFGIHIPLIWHNATRFIVKMFSPWVLISSTGALWWLWHIYKERTYSKTIAAYFTIIFPISLWLFAVYGSWQISDNPGNPAAVTMGASYIRYWLPHLIFRMPFAGYLLYEFARYYPKFKPWVFKTCVAFAVVFGIVRSFFGVDGLIDVVKNVRASQRVVQQVSGIVPTGAVLAVRTWDKNFFPQFAVLQPFPREIKTYAAARELLQQHAQVWAFIETLTDTDTLWLRQNGLHALPYQQFNQHTLYELELWPR